MKTPVVVRAIGFGVLTTVLCEFAWQALAADKPLLLWTTNQLVLTKSMRHDLDRDPNNIADAIAPQPLPMPLARLIPTNWESNNQLIPTEIEARTLPVRRFVFISNRPLVYDDQQFYLNRQVRHVARRTFTPPLTQRPAESALKLTRPASK